MPVAFLELVDGTEQPALDGVQKWVRKVLGRHKAPTKVFWLGTDFEGEVPLTGSGKIKKFELKAWAEAVSA